MKKLIVLSLLLSSTTYAYTCNRSVDPKKMVVFVDSNISTGEVESAAKAACERGESFKSIPEQSKLKTAIEKKKEVTALDNKLKARCKTDAQWATQKCQDLSNQVNVAYDIFYNETKKVEVTQGLLQTELSKLAAANIAVSSMVVSGHDGGGSIHGDLGGVDKTEIVQSMKTAYKNKPSLLNEFHSVFMWGCWTMGPSEVSYWRDNLPSLRMTGGFFDMGPLNTTRATKTVLHDLLVKEKQIYQTCDNKKVKKLINSVENINSTYAAVYAESQCGGSNYFYNTKGDGSDAPNLKAGQHFVDYDSNFDCKKMAPLINKQITAVMKYYRGDIPIPTNTSTSPLREIYAFARNNARCLKPNHVLNGDRILMMIFEQDVRKNFKDVFADTITEANKEFDHLTALFKKYPPKTSQFAALKKVFQAGDDKFFKLTPENLKNKSRKELRSMINYLNGVMDKSKEYIKVNKDFAKNVNGLKKLKNAMETYLYQMNPNCMDFLEWHEYKPGHKPYAACNV